MILHTVNKPGETLARCLALVAENDVVLLLEDGVYAGMDNTANAEGWQQVAPSTTCYALESDLAARGISDRMLPRFKTVNWEKFVALAVSSDKVVSWG